MTRAQDALAAERRRMPWMAGGGDVRIRRSRRHGSLLDLFAGRRQLIVYRAFFEPGVHGWPEHACPGCSMLADQVAHPAHLNARDTTLVFVSRGPQAEHRPAEGQDGLGHPVVHDHRRFRLRLRRGRMARHQRLHSRRRRTSSAPTSSTTVATRRWAGRGAISTSRRSDGRRVGGLPRGLPAVGAL